MSTLEPKDHDPFFSPLERHMQGDIVRYACSRSMWCDCGALLDMRRSVYLDSPAAIRCSSCMDRLFARMVASNPVAAENAIGMVRDGSYLRGSWFWDASGRRRAHPRKGDGPEAIVRAFRALWPAGGED